jgi:hypothetical protein
VANLYYYQTSKFKNMKKLSFLFVAIAFVGIISLNSCKPATPPPAAPAVEAPAVVDSAAAVVADTASAVVEE